MIHEEEKAEAGRKMKRENEANSFLVEQGKRIRAYAQAKYESDKRRNR